MKAKNLRIRMAPDGDLWLTEERPFDTVIKRVKNMTGEVLLALSAELVKDAGTEELVKDIKFSDGMAIRVSVQLIKDAQGWPNVLGVGSGVSPSVMRADGDR